MKTKNKKAVEIFYIISAAIFLAISFYVVSYCTGDDAGTYMWIYRQYELGSVHYDLKTMLDPWNITISLIYFLNLSDNGVHMAMGCFAVWYFFNTLLTLLIAMQDVRKNKWILWLVVFIMIPWGWTNKCHEVATCFSLLIIYLFNRWMKTKKKKYILIAVIIFFYGFVVLNDRMLLVLFGVAPIVVYYILLCVQDKTKHKYLYLASGVSVILVVGIKMVDEIYINVSGHGLVLLEAWGGYGGADYLTWMDIYNLFDKGIPSFFQALFNQYNIPISGGMIQINSFFWLIRILLVGLIICAFINCWKSIIKYGIEKVEVLDAIAVIGVTVLACVNVCNGIMKDYGTDLTNYPLNRYASLAWSLLIIVFVRWIDERFEAFEFVLCKRKINSGFILGIISILLIFGYSKPIYNGREGIGTEPCVNEIEFLKETEDNYKYGVASYWKAFPITAMTSGEYVACAGDIRDEVLTCIMGQEDYSVGSNMFNYIISYVRNAGSMDEENIEKIRGDYIEKKRVYSDSETYTDKHGIWGEAGESIIYLYDYDIRFEPKLIMQAVGTNYELVEPIEYHYDLPVGINRIEMQVTNSDNFVLNVLDNPDISDVSVKIVDEYKIYVDLKCEQNTTATLQVAKNDDTQTTIHKIVVKRVNAAICLNDTMPNVSEGQVYLKTGEYVFTFEGEGLDNLQVIWEGTDIKTEQLTDGKMRNRYKVTVNSPQVISYQVSGENIYVGKVSYENEELFQK